MWNLKVFLLNSKTMAYEGEREHRGRNWSVCAKAGLCPVISNCND